MAKKREMSKAQEGLAEHIERFLRVDLPADGSLKSFVDYRDREAADILETRKGTKACTSAAEVRRRAPKLQERIRAVDLQTRRLVWSAIRFGRAWGEMETLSGLTGARHDAYLALTNNGVEGQKVLADFRERTPEKLAELQIEAKDEVWTCLSVGITHTHGTRENPGIYDIVWKKIKAAKREDAADHLTAREFKALIPVARREWRKRKEKSPASG